MGQIPSSDEFLSGELVQDDILRHARILTEIAGLSYDDFVDQLGELNRLSKQCMDSKGKRLVFAVKKGTDCTILWKGTVKIGCVKMDPITSKIDSYRLLNLMEFIQVFKTLRGHSKCIEETKNDFGSCNDTPTTSENVAPALANNYLSASMLFQHVDEMTGKKSSLEKCSECCICLERQTEVILPCAHSYCLPCIEQWNVNNKTCPICRERLETTDDTWVISEAPDAQEITDEICMALNELSEISPTRQVKS